MAEVKERIVNHKDADTPDELTRWIWAKYVGVPVAGDAWGQEYENLLDRVRRMDRSSFTKGLHEGVRQTKTIAAVASHAPATATDILEAAAKRLEHVDDSSGRYKDAARLVRGMKADSPAPSAPATGKLSNSGLSGYIRVPAPEPTATQSGASAAPEEPTK